MYMRMVLPPSPSPQAAPGFDALIPSSASHKSTINALLFYVTGPEQAPHPKRVWKSLSGRDHPLGATLLAEPGPPVPASTAAAAPGQVPGGTAGSGSLPGVW